MPTGISPSSPIPLLSSLLLFCGSFRTEQLRESARERAGERAICYVLGPLRAKTSSFIAHDGRTPASRTSTHTYVDGHSKAKKKRGPSIYFRSNRRRLASAHVRTGLNYGGIRRAARPESQPRNSFATQNIALMRTRCPTDCGDTRSWKENQEGKVEIKGKS
jgi:hypothetical protein